MQETAEGRAPARRRKLSLERKLAAYAIATGAILATPDQATAEIIYSGVVDQPVGQNASLNLDLNGDGTTDFTISESDGGPPAGDGVLAVGGLGNNAVVITPPFAAALNPFDMISANDQLGGGAIMASADHVSGAFGPWLDAQNKFLGLRFVFPDSSTHYGWARLSVYISGDYLPYFDATVHDWAYEDTPDKPILAGETIGGGTPAPPPPAPPPPPIAPEPTPLALLARGAAGVEIHLRNQPCPSVLPGNSSWSAGMPPTGK